MKNRKMKKIFVSTVLLLLVCAMIGCGEYTEAIKQPNGTTAPDESTTATPPSDSVPDENAYTVSLRYNGDPYIPKDKVFAHWTDGYSFYNAEFNEQGIATVGDLDGNYDVTLSSVPDGLIYNPNIYVATADERNVVIDLYDITEPTKGTGKSLYRCFELEDIGVFRADIKKANTVVYYQFVPSEEGTYVVESWVDITAGEINPKADLYNGTFASKFFDRTLDDGGASKGYTKNFRYEINVDADMIGNVYTFAVHVETKATEFSPVNVDFAISRNGSYVRPRTEKAMEIPTELYATINRELDKLLAMSWEDYSAALSRYAAPNDPPLRTTYENLKNYENEDPTNPNERLFKVMGEDEYYHIRLYLKNLYNEEGRLTYPEIRVGGKNIFDGSMFKLNPEDGFYHLYDEEKYAETDGYGPTVYAAITTPCRFLQLSLTHIEDPGNKSLTIRVEENGEYLDHNYKHFLEGYDDLATWSGSVDMPPYYCSYKCPCHGGGKYGLACPPDCEGCISDCTPCRKELIGGPGYADFANRDGYFPLTEELRVFLQRLSEAQRYFNDGAGWVEENDVIDVDAMQDDQWLFACAYYTE
ncbi:MAG: hypothetical protein IJX46_09755 [Clostridia bacterium]|nr:hypothetical protein [Clostridia bacterium]